MQELHRLSIPRDLLSKTANLRNFFQRLDGVLVAFSGGVDSTLVLKIAKDVLGDRTTAVTAASPTLPREELAAVRQLSQEIGARLIVASTNQLNDDAFVRNDATRCYHCKTDLYRLLAPVQRDTGIATIVDGAHVDDLGDDRPGMRAARGIRGAQPAGGSRVSEGRRAHPGQSAWASPTGTNPRPRACPPGFRGARGLPNRNYSAWNRPNGC